MPEDIPETEEEMRREELERIIYGCFETSSRGSLDAIVQAGAKYAKAEALRAMSDLSFIVNKDLRIQIVSPEGSPIRLNEVVAFLYDVILKSAVTVTIDGQTYPDAQYIEAVIENLSGLILNLEKAKTAFEYDEEPSSRIERRMEKISKKYDRSDSPSKGVIGRLLSGFRMKIK